MCFAKTLQSITVCFEVDVYIIMFAYISQNWLTTFLNLCLKDSHELYRRHFGVKHEVKRILWGWYQETIFCSDAFFQRLNNLEPETLS